MNECDMYLDTVDVIEGRIEDDTKFPIVKNTKIKQICRMVLEFLTIIIYYLKNTINAPKEKQ